jgi:hypothetical protein
MQVETRFVRLREPAALGHPIDGWRVSWIGGWDRHRLFYWVMLTRPAAAIHLPETEICFFCDVFASNQTDP